MKRRDFILRRAVPAFSFFAFSSSRAFSKPNPPTLEAAIVADPEGVEQRLLAEAQRVFKLNLVESERGRFHVPSALGYPRFYAWDSGWHIIALSAFDPAAALDELEAVFNFQVDSGRVPHEAVLPERPLEQDGTFQRLGYDLFDADGRSYMLDPPSYLVAAEELYRRRPDPRILALLPRMEKCLDYLIGPRDLLGDGLASAVHRWEPGTDMAPSYDEVLGVSPWDPAAFLKIEKRSNETVRLYAGLGWDLGRIKAANRFVLEDPGLNALTAAGALSVSRLWRAAGDAVRAERWQSRAQDMVGAMEKYLWNERAGFFYPRYDAHRPKLCSRASLTGLAPLMTGLVSPDKTARIIEQYLTSPDHFWAPWLVPFNSLAEMRRDPPGLYRGQLWRGSCIWISLNWITARAAHAAGRDDLAREITRRTAVMIDRHGFREYYRPQSGRGAGAPGFSWPALVLPMIQEYGLAESGTQGGE